MNTCPQIAGFFLDEFITWVIDTKKTWVMIRSITQVIGSYTATAL